MRRTLVATVAATLLLAGLASWQAAAAQHDTMHSPAAAAPAKTSATAPAATAAAPPTGLRALASRQIVAAQKKLIALAEATPPEKYAWRPADGVRSVGEVYMHVAGANYFLPTFWGAKPAAGVDPRTLEKDGGDKAKTVAALKQSFDYAQQAIDAVPDADLAKAVQVFGRASTTGEVMLGLGVHAHEHLGQSIAYARMNGIVPPWSAAGQ
ncbi:MAG TPA: DinB family protein [Thermoanaerobaculia bacterium]|nr:DinB family protein [Thermoanaerobaculia bacterium]